MIIRQILHNALIALIYSSSLLASAGKSALTATACTATASESSSHLAALYKKSFPQGHNSQLWQEIVTTITHLRLIAAKELAHDRAVTAVAWHPACTHLATGSGDGKARIWDAQSGNPLHILNHQSWVRAVAWNPAGTHLATASDDKTARIWDAQSGKPLHTLDHQDWVNAVAWHPAGTHLATGSDDNKARIWDAQSGKPLHTLDHQNLVLAVAWHPACTHLATASGYSKARIWDAQSGKPLHTLDHQDCVRAVAWNPAGTHLATASDDSKARIWDAQSGTPVHILDHQGLVRAVAWNPAGTHLATGSYDDKARTWDTAHLADPKYKEQYNQFKAGTLPAETLMLIHAFDQFAKQKKDYTSATLKEVVDQVRTRGITVAQLAGTLLTLHPIIMHGILQHYGILLCKQSHKKNGVKAKKGTMQESYANSYKALEETLQTLKFAHSNDRLSQLLIATP
jgi:hypothetical protein